MLRLSTRLLLLIFVISVIIGLYLRYSTRVIEYTMGPGTERQIDSSFKWALNNDYDILILGSSKFYRGLNPDLLGLPAFNFAHDNDAYNQMYYKLLFLKEHNKSFNYLIISVDYAPFSNISETRNHLYKKYFDAEYFNDYKLGSTTNGKLIKDFNDSFDRFMKIRFSMTFTKFVESVPALFMKRNYQEIPYMKSNGQYIKPGKPTPDLFVTREFTSSELQENYFHKILDHCRKENIKVFLIMPPFLANDLKLYPEESIPFYQEYFNTLSDSINIWYLDYTTSTLFSEEDFTGLAHLNENAADRFSEILNDRIKKILNPLKY
jgi:hypothetical protein